MPGLHARRFCLPAILAFLLSACGPAEESREINFQVPVAVEEVRLGTVENKVVSSGTLRAPEVETLTAMSPGILQINNISDEGGKTRRYAEGDRVRAGDEIARITGEDLRLETRLQAARQLFVQAESDLEAKRRLFDRQLINRTELEQAVTAFEEAKLELERSRHTDDRSHLVATIDGVILRLARDANGQLMANGQLISAGQEIARIAPLEELIADVDLVGRDGIAGVQPGMEARVVYHARGDKVFRGEVLRLAPTVDQTTRALRAEVSVDNSSLELRPGMFVEVTLISERRENVPVIPRAAVTERGGRQVVFALRGQRVE